MSSKTIDTKIVEMEFDNKDFEKNIEKSINSVESLKKTLEMDDSIKSYNKLYDAIKEISSHTEELSNVFGGLSSVFERIKASTFDQVIRNITNSFYEAAASVGNFVDQLFGIQAAKSGFEEYQMQQNAIQTILSNTQKEGTTLGDVTAALDELNEYADKTIYNFTEMVNNIGTFTAAGVKLKPAATAIKGIANVAAISGANATAASRAMYQLSQALATGTVNLQDWKSVENAGMGGTMFQDALIQTAERMGRVTQAAIDAQGGFRASLSQQGNKIAGWLNNDVLLETLQQFAGDGDADYWKNLGYTDEQVANIVTMGETATHAAQDVRTIKILFDAIIEAAQSGWTETWKLIIGDYEEATKMLTAISNEMSYIIDSVANLRINALKGWKLLGGRDMMLEALADLYWQAADMVAWAVDLFGDIFNDSILSKPREWGLRLRDATWKFLKSVRSIGDETNSIQRSIDGALKQGIQNFLWTLKDVWLIVVSIKDIFVAMYQAALPSIITVLYTINDTYNQVFEGLISNYIAGFRLFVEELGGLEIIGEIFNNIFDSLSSLINVVLSALSDVFGWSTVFEDDEGIYESAYAIEEFSLKLLDLSEKLYLSDDKADALYDVLYDFFSLIKKILGVVTNLTSALDALSKGITGVKETSDTSSFFMDIFYNSINGLAYIIYRLVGFFVLAANAIVDFFTRAGELESVQRLGKTLVDIGKKIKNGLLGALMAVLGFFKELLGLSDDFTFTDLLLLGVDNAAKAINMFLTNIGPDLINGVKMIFGGIGYLIEEVVGKFSDFGDGIKSMFAGVDEEVEEGSKPLTNFMSSLKDGSGFDTFLDKIKKFGERVGAVLKEGLENGTFKDIEKIGFIVWLGAMLFNINKFTKGLADIVTNAAKIISNFADLPIKLVNAVEEIGKLVGTVANGIQNQMNANAFATFTLSIAALIFALRELSDVPEDQLVNATAALIVITIALLSLFEAYKKMMIVLNRGNIRMAKAKGTKAMGTGMSLLGIGLMVAGIAAAIAYIGTSIEEYGLLTTIEHVAVAMVAITIMIGILLAAVFIVMKKIEASTATINTRRIQMYSNLMAIMAFGVIAMAVSIALLSLIPLGNLVQAVLAVAAITIAIALVLRFLTPDSSASPSYIHRLEKYYQGLSTSLVLIAISLALITVPLIYIAALFNVLPDGIIWEALAVLVVFLAAVWGFMIGIAKLVPSTSVISPHFAGSMVALGAMAVLISVTVLIIATAIEIMSPIMLLNPVGILASAGIMIGVLAILFLGMEALIKAYTSGHMKVSDMLSIAGAVIIVGVTIRIIAEAMTTVAAIDMFDKGGASVLALLSFTLLILAAVFALAKYIPHSNDVLKVSAGILIASASILVIAAALKLISEIDLTGSWKAFAAFAAIFAVIIVMFIGLGIASAHHVDVDRLADSFLKIGFVFLSVSGAFLIFAAALWVLGKALPVLGPALVDFCDNVAEAATKHKVVFTVLVVLIIAITAALIAFGPAVSSALQTVITGLGHGLSSIWGHLTTGLSSLWTHITTWARGIWGHITHWWGGLSAATKEQIKDFIIAASLAIAIAGPQIAEVLAEVLDNILIFLEVIIPVVVDAIVRIIIMLLAALVGAIDNHKAELSYWIYRLIWSILDIVWRIVIAAFGTLARLIIQLLEPIVNFIMGIPKLFVGAHALLGSITGDYDPEQMDKEIAFLEGSFSISNLLDNWDSGWEDTVDAVTNISLPTETYLKESAEAEKEANEANRKMNHASTDIKNSWQNLKDSIFGVKEESENLQNTASTDTQSIVASLLGGNVEGLPNAIGSGWGDVSNANDQGLTRFYDDYRNGITSTGDDFDLFNNDVINSITGNANGAIGEGFDLMGDATQKGMFGVQGLVEDGVLNIAGSSVDVSSFENAGDLNMAALINGYQNGGVDFSALAGTVSKDGADEAAAQKNSYMLSGRDLVRGLSSGVDMGKPLYLETMARLASAGNNEFRRVNRIASPSKLYFEYGSYIIQGLANGISENGQYAYDSVKQTSGRMYSMYADAFSGINGLASNGLRPVLDMSSINQGLSNMNGLMTSATIDGRLFSDYDTQDFEADLRYDDTVVVKEIHTLQEEISRLADELTNMQMVLDTGALVGQIADPLDEEFGMRAIRRSRGN